MHSFRCLRCVVAFTQPKILGTDQPIIVVTITVMIRDQYSGGIGGGSGLKFTVNVPYRLTVRFPEESSGKVEAPVVLTGGKFHL